MVLRLILEVKLHPKVGVHGMEQVDIMVALPSHLSMNIPIFRPIGKLKCVHKNGEYYAILVMEY